MIGWWSSIHRNPPPVGQRIIVETKAGYVCEAYRSPRTYYRYDGVNLNDDLFGTVVRWKPLTGMTEDDPTWTLFNDLSCAAEGKQIYFLQKNGKVYSRRSCQELTFDQAVKEFTSTISIDNLPGLFDCLEESK